MEGYAVFIIIGFLVTSAYGVEHYFGTTNLALWSIIGLARETCDSRLGLMLVGTYLMGAVSAAYN
jgi:hypothetical protein